MTIEALVNAVGPIAGVSTELSNVGTSLYVDTTADEVLWAKRTRLRLGAETATELILVEIPPNGASPWTIVERHCEHVNGGAATAVAHAVGTKVYQELTVAGLESAAVPAPQSITQPMLYPYSVGPLQLEPGCLTADKYTDEEIETDAYRNASVTEIKMARGSEGKLVPGPGNDGEFLELTSGGPVWGFPSVTDYEPIGFALVGEPETGIPSSLELFFPAGTRHLIRLGFRIAVGTHVTGKLLKNGSPVTGFTFEAVSTENRHVEPSAVSVSSGDWLELEITAAVGNPKNLAVTGTLRKTT